MHRLSCTAVRAPPFVHRLSCTVFRAPSLSYAVPPHGHRHTRQSRAFRKFMVQYLVAFQGIPGLRQGTVLPFVHRLSCTAFRAPPFVHRLCRTQCRPTDTDTQVQVAPFENSWFSLSWPFTGFQACGKSRFRHSCTAFRAPPFVHRPHGEDTRDVDGKWRSVFSHAYAVSARRQCSSVGSVRLCQCPTQRRCTNGGARMAVHEGHSRDLP